MTAGGKSIHPKTIKDIESRFVMYLNFVYLSIQCISLTMLFVKKHTASVALFLV